MATAIYAVNFKAEELRAHRTPNRISFAALDDATAAAIVAVWSAQVTSAVSSTVKRIHSNLSVGAYPPSTGYNAIVRLRDAAGAAYTARLRNAIKGTATDTALATLFTGTPVPVYLPNSHGLCTLASPAFSDLH